MSVYRSCHSVEGELFFNHLNKVGYCCMLFPSGGQPILYSNYRGELIDWNEFFKNREKHIELMKNGSAIEECKNCFWIRKKDWPERTNSFRYILINVWVNCNLYCTYCAIHSKVIDLSETIEYDIAAVIKDMIDKKVVTPDTKIDIAGGEATLDKNFNKFLSMLLAEGIKNININTNATIYTPSISAGIKKGVVSVITSVDSGSKEKFIEIKKADLWDRTWENIKKYSMQVDKEHNSNTVKSKFIIIPGVNDSKSQIRNFLILSKKSNVSGVIINIDFNWIRDNPENADNHEKVIQIFELIKYFIKISSLLNLDWSVWAHLEDLFLRHNRCHQDMLLDIDIINNRDVNFKIKNEFFEKILLKILNFIK